MIVFAVKLVHRNQELDDLYDEYDIPFDDEEDTPVQNKKSSAKPADDYEDDDYEDDYDDEDDYEDDDYEDDDDDYDYDDEDDESATTQISGSKDRGTKKEDDYSIDFVDL